MNKVFFNFILAFALLLNCCQYYFGKKKANNCLQLGMAPIDNCGGVLDSFYLLTSSSNTERAYLYKMEGIKYEVVLNEIRKIKYLSTNDSNYINPEGLKVGSTIHDLKNNYNFNRLTFERGWAAYFDLGNNWYCAFDCITDDDFKRINDSSKIVFFFQKQFH